VSVLHGLFVFFHKVLQSVDVGLIIFFPFFSILYPWKSKADVMEGLADFVRMVFVLEQESSVVAVLKVLESVVCSDNVEFQEGDGGGNPSEGDVFEIGEFNQSGKPFLKHKIPELIVKIESGGHSFYALSSLGNVFSWRGATDTTSLGFLGKEDGMSHLLK